MRLLFNVLARVAGSFAEMRRFYSLMSKTTPTQKTNSVLFCLTCCVVVVALAWILSASALEELLELACLVCCGVEGGSVLVAS
jgi:hypothetical protein